MSASETLVWAGLALPDADAPPQTRFAVLVRGGVIHAAGGYDALRSAHPAASVVGHADALLIPGLVNAHDHGRGVGAAALGVPDDLLEVWLPGLAAQAALEPELRARLSAARLLQSGVTGTVHSHNPQEWSSMAQEAAPTLAGYRAAGVRVAFHLPIVDQNQLVYAEAERFLNGLPPALRATAQQLSAPPGIGAAAYLAQCDALLAQHHDGALVHIQAGPAGGQWCSDELISACVGWAAARGTRAHMHLLETYYQMRYAHRRWDTTALRHLDAIGALGPQLTLAHLVWPDVDDLPVLAARGVAVAHNPSANIRLRSGIAPLAEIARAGVTVGIGLDGHALDDDQDMLRELRLAWTLANRPGAEAPSVAARDIWHIGTVGGARAAFGPQSRLGVLAHDRPADLALLDLRTALFDPNLAGEALRGALLRLVSARHVTDVMVDGAWRLRAGQITEFDLAATEEAARAQLRAAPPLAQRPGALAAQALGPYLRRFYQSWNE